MQVVQHIYQQYAASVYRFALGLCGDKHLANDLVAETFLRAILNAHHLGISTSSAKVKVIRARVKLAQLLKKKS